MDNRESSDNKGEEEMEGEEAGESGVVYREASSDSLY